MGRPSLQQQILVVYSDAADISYPNSIFQPVNTNNVKYATSTDHFVSYLLLPLWNMVLALTHENIAMCIQIHMHVQVPSFSTLLLLLVSKSLEGIKNLKGEMDIQSQEAVVR